MAGKCVLVVEDNPINMKMFAADANSDASFNVGQENKKIAADTISAIFLKLTSI